MARKLPKRVIATEQEDVSRDDPSLQEARAKHEGSADGGGAWARAGAHATLGELKKLTDQRVVRVLNGEMVIQLSPDQVTDGIGSDRHGDWVKDEAFAELKASLEANGQDVPIQVIPVDPDWQPGFAADGGVKTEGAAFHVISGRRRLEALRQLGKPVRAICISRERASADFDQLHLRYRENVEREDLTLLEELLAIGEMFSHEKTFGEKMTGRALAKRLSITDAKVSKGRAVYDNRERLFKEVKDPHALTLHELDAIIPSLRSGDPLKPETKLPSPPRPPSAPTLKRTQIIRGRKIVAKAKGGRISLDMGREGMVDEAFLDRLLLFIQAEQRKDG